MNGGHIEGSGKQESYFDTLSGKITNVLSEVKGKTGPATVSEVKSKLEELKALATSLFDEMSAKWEEMKNKPFDQVPTDALLRVYKSRELVHHTRHFIQAMGTDFETFEKD